MMVIKYPVLESKIAERGIKKTKIAKAINVSYQSLTNKLVGNTAFTWDEVCAVQERFFPDMQLKELFSRTV